MVSFTEPQQAFVGSRAVHGAARPDQPQVEQQFWGYEIGPAESERGALALARGVFILLALACGLAAAGIWLIPAAADGLAPLPRLVLSAMLGGAAAALHARAEGHRAVRLQVDTARGELREVTGPGIGRAPVLGVYGFDAVSGVVLHCAGARGQLQVRLACGDVLPAGTGDPADLEPLRARLAADLRLPGGA